MSPTALAGLAVTAHDNAALNIATFTDVLLLPGGGGASRVGSHGRTGSIVDNPTPGTWTGAAGDIWNTGYRSVGIISVTAPPAGGSIDLVSPSPGQTTGPSLSPDRNLGPGNFVWAMNGRSDTKTTPASRRNTSAVRWMVAALDSYFANDPVLNGLF